jgi:hypothetical protein
MASWLGLARDADAYRLSRAILTARDVRNLGKRLPILGVTGAMSGAGVSRPACLAERRRSKADVAVFLRDRSRRVSSRHR